MPMQTSKLCTRVPIFKYFKTHIYITYIISINISCIYNWISQIVYETPKMLATPLFRPHQEYCVQAWNPYLTRDIDILEKVQRRATKCVQGLAHLPYKSHLEKLNLYSLFGRLQRGDMIETYKMLNQYYDIEPSTFFALNIQSSTRGHSIKLFKERSRLLVRHNFFSNRIGTLYLTLSFQHLQ